MVPLRSESATNVAAAIVGKMYMHKAGAACLVGGLKYICVLCLFMAAMRIPVCLYTF